MPKAGKHSFRKMRIYLTERCNQDCPFCFNKKDRNGKDMDFNKLKIALKYLKKFGFKRVDLMGGEPLLYSKFAEVLKETRANDLQVSIFTNGTILFPPNIIPKDTDRIVYNFSFVNKKDFFKNLKTTARIFNGIGFDMVVTADCKIEQLKKNIDKVIKKMSDWGIEKSRYSFTASLDCSSNIFLHQKELNEKLVELFSFLNLKQIMFGSDHSLPFCFMNTRLKLITKRRGIYGINWCPIESAGLLDADFNLKFCSVFPAQVGNFFTSEDKVISLKELKACLKKAYQIKLQHKKNILCKDCPYWLKKCNGACFPQAKRVDALK